VDKQIKYILTDIEGTTSSVSFVYEVLFPYFRAHIQDLPKLSLINEVKQAFSEVIEIVEQEENKHITTTEEVLEYLRLWSEQDRKITDSLFPAIALYAPNRREQIAAWSGKTTEEIQLLLVMDYPESQLSNAYRNLFVPPLTLGISIFFALLNLAQWVGMTVGIFRKPSGSSTWIIHLATSVTFIGLLLFSFMAEK
jgi:hypothetical protein